MCVIIVGRRSEVMKKKSIINGAVTTVLLGLLIYAAYSLWYIFYGKDSGWDVHLYTVLSGSALGWFWLFSSIPC